MPRRRNKGKETFGDNWTPVAVAGLTKSRLGPRVQKVIDARRAASVMVRGVAGVSSIMVCNDISMMGLICQYLRLPDLYELRQINRTTMKAVTTYVRAPNGLAQRLWDRMRFDPLYAPLVIPIQQFQSNIANDGHASYVTGSILMSLLSGDNWRVGDIDIVVEGNINTLKSFRQLLLSLGDYVLRVKIHDSLAAEEPPIGIFAANTNKSTTTTAPTPTPSLNADTDDNDNDNKDKNGVASTSSSSSSSSSSASSSSSSLSSLLRRFHDHVRILPESEMTAEEWKTIEETKLADAMRHSTLPSAREFQALQQISSKEINDSKQTFALTESGYNKHARSLYYSIDILSPDSRKNCHCPKDANVMPANHIIDSCPAPHTSIDILFIPGLDCAASGGLWGWMDRNFDVQLCVNGVNPNGMRIHAPREFLSRRVYIRTDQYCMTYNARSKSFQRKPQMKSNASMGRMACNCHRILPKRIAKYEARHYNVICASYDEYNATIIRRVAEQRRAAAATLAKASSSSSKNRSSSSSSIMASIPTMTTRIASALAVTSSSSSSSSSSEFQYATKPTKPRRR